MMIQVEPISYSAINGCQNSHYMSLTCCCGEVAELVVSAAN